MPETNVNIPPIPTILFLNNLQIEKFMTICGQISEK